MTHSSSHLNGTTIGNYKILVGLNPGGENEKKKIQDNKEPVVSTVRVRREKQRLKKRGRSNERERHFMPK